MFEPSEHWTCVSRCLFTETIHDSCDCYSAQFECATRKIFGAFVGGNLSTRVKMNSSSPNRCETRKHTLPTFNMVHLKNDGFPKFGISYRLPGCPLNFRWSMWNFVTDLIHPHLQNLETWKILRFAHCLDRWKKVPSDVFLSILVIFESVESEIVF